MNLREALNKNNQPLVPPVPDVPVKPGSKQDKTKIGEWIRLLKDGDSLKITYVINKIPRLEIQSWIDKLSRYKYQKYPGTAIAISKLKWRRGY